MQNIIIVENLGKRYSRYHTHKPVTIMEAALSGFRRLREVEKFWALRDVNFTVSPGEMLGIIGHNGAGKSTLLQLLGGVGRPDEGQIKILGKIGALLDLGSGFSPDLTGRENVFVTGIVAGLTRQEVAKRFDKIVEFAELEEFIDNPVRTYSTGMQMRLAFAVAVHTDPEVMLVDEFLSVGDIAFQSKCLERISQLKAQGCAIVLVSHSTDQVKELCDRALWLRHGQMVAYGEPEVVAGQYESEMRSETQKRTPPRPPELASSGIELRVNENRFGSLEMEITQVTLSPSGVIEAGESLKVEIYYSASLPINSPIVSVTISDENGQICLNTNTKTLNTILPVISEPGKMSLTIDRLDLSVGHYFVDVGIYEKEWAYAYDYHWHVYPLLINGQQFSQSLLNSPCHWRVEQA